MSTFVNVSTERMSGDISDMSGELDAVERESNSLYESITALGSMWTGSAHDEFQRQFQNDKNMMEKNINQMKNYLEDLENCRSSYAQCEQNVDNMVQSI